ncbi:ester cyclase [Duganella radicis]|uniref:Ester cyclase n=1 Tax=Duganella radicis TaxID=551988 RepID=A0A6L6PNF2_9BURK|nr:ester cyclase [Duganella radicis]MTV40493.1 ester cyclase [Duganella radicis]
MKALVLASLLTASAAHADPVADAARTYAAFWNTGDPALAQKALAPNFIDRTLPAGREQGPNGPLQASKAFRAAVPDLRAEATHIVPNGDHVTVRLHFTGHFTGKFGETQGQGQTIDFQAFDLYHVVDGRIAENWHLEDNLTLLQQMGLMSGPQSAPAKTQ